MVVRRLWLTLLAQKWFILAGLGFVGFIFALAAILDRYLISFRVIPVTVSSVLLAASLLLIYGSARRIWHNLIRSISPFWPVKIKDVLYTDIKKKHGPRIVVIGGGTGLSVLLKGLKRYTNNLTAVVTVTDDGGSSGRLRGELGVLPPGDVRRCLVALAEKENLMEHVIQHRFTGGDSVGGHNMGNLLLAALTEITGDFVKAITEVGKVLAVQGKVLPATLESVTLGAVMKSGQTVMGETAITRSGIGISKVFLEPSDCQPLPEAVEAILNADAVVLGPGSLYTSIMPNLLVREIGDAVKQSAAAKIFVVNIMTQPGETTDYTASQHLQAVIDHMGPGWIDYVVVNQAELDEERRARYLAEEAKMVFNDLSDMDGTGIKVISEPLLGQEEVAWHDPDALARVIMRIVYSRKGLNWMG